MFVTPDNFMPPQAAMEDGMAGAVGVLVVFYMLFFLLMMAFSVAVYVLGSLGLYTVAQRRGIRRSWLAWIPLGNLWILGSLSDQYQYIARGKVKNRRKIILTLGIVLIAGYFLWLFTVIISAIAGGEVGAALSALFGVLAIGVAAIWLAVCQYMACYDLFKSCDPDNAVLYLVLSILFSVTLPFFMFACRKKDLGMPPRRQATPSAVAVEPEAEPVVCAAEPAQEGFAHPEEFEDI